jgi:hypothetical protein
MARVHALGPGATALHRRRGERLDVRKIAGWVGGTNGSGREARGQNRAKTKINLPICGSVTGPAGKLDRERAIRTRI